MKEIKNDFKRERIIRFIFAAIGLFVFLFSPSIAWGIILTAAISKESMDLKAKEAWILLSLILGVMPLAIYFLLNSTAALSYILSTILYFILR